MSIRQLETRMFGREVSFAYSETWIGYALFSLRVIMGWEFFYAGIVKVIDPKWSVRGFLLYGIPQANPFTSLWTTMANEWYWLLTPLNQLGLTFIGLGLIFGAFTRLSAFWGGVMFLFYWVAHYPFDNSFLIDYHLIYVFILFGLGAFGAGRILGLDAWIENLSIVEENPRLKLLLG
ncbi:MAG: thiosulfate dehydrogenase [quinone] large subunit [Halobacteriales archaeon]|jgi:thiosulfate dehydrogenase [quinone] large subunit